MFSTLNFCDYNLTSLPLKGATSAYQIFENGWAVSVISGPKGSGIYGIIGEDTFEVSIIRPNECMLEDVMEWQTPVQVSSIMRLVSML
jgi:hypothetical protein